MYYTRGLNRYDDCLDWYPVPKQLRNLLTGVIRNTEISSSRGVATADSSSTR